MCVTAREALAPGATWWAGSIGVECSGERNREGVGRAFDGASPTVHALAADAVPRSRKGPRPAKASAMRQNETCLLVTLHVSSAQLINGPLSPCCSGHRDTALEPGMRLRATTYLSKR